MFTSLREMREKQNDMEDLVKQIEDTTKKSYEKEEEGVFWSPPADKMGNGLAIIRFLPAPKGEDAAFVRRWDHGFQGPSGKWYIENSLTTLGPDHKDPVSEDNSRLWALEKDGEFENDSGPNRTLAKSRKRRLNHYSNILVIKDPARPENEGKVFLFKYGVKIFDKIKAAGKPPVEGMAKFNPFNMFTGANLQLVVCNVKKRRNYDQSAFLPCSAIEGTDEQLDAIWDKCRSLKDFLDPRHFKSYEVLKKRFEYVTNSPATLEVRNEGLKSEMAPDIKSEEPRKPAGSAPAAEEEEPEDTEEYFKSLANKA